MRKILFIFFLISLNSSAQNSFPENWIGEYEGEMIMVFGHNPNDTVPVEFELMELIPDSIWTYRMTYHSAKFGEIVKDYRFVAVSKDNKVDFLLDELNGIIMEQTLMNDCMYGMYEVLDYIYTITLRLHENNLIMELYGSSLKNPMITVSEPDESQGETEATEAKSLKPTLVQSVYLRRK